MMNIYEFAQKCAAAITGYITDVKEVVKNNDTVLTGVTFLKENNSIAPTVYMDSYYAKWEAGEMSFEDVIKNISNVVENAYDNNPISLSSDDIAEFVMHYNNAKSKIRTRIVNTSRNAKLLQDLPRIAFEDLSIIFYIDVTNEGGVSSIKVTNSIFNQWGVTTDELLKVANENTPWNVKSMRETLLEIISEKGDFELMSLIEATANEEETMFVASNSTKLFGASVMANPDFLEHFSDTHNGNSFYILPSSVHEVLFLPVGEGETLDEDHLSEMVHNVNSTELQPEDFLSDNVYFYDAKKKKVFLTFGNREEAVI